MLVNSLTQLQKIIIGVAPTAMNALLYKHSGQSTTSNRNKGTRGIIPCWKLYYCYYTFQPRLQAQRNFLFHKAVRIYKEINDRYNSHEEININTLNIKPFKRIIKEYVMEIQSSHTADEWTIQHFRLYEKEKKRKKKKKNILFWIYTNIIKHHYYIGIKIIKNIIYIKSNFII